MYPYGIIMKTDFHEYFIPGISGYMVQNMKNFPGIPGKKGPYQNSIKCCLANILLYIKIEKDGPGILRHIHLFYYYI